MKLLLPIFSLLLLCCTSCGLNEQQQLLKQKEAEMHQKQQELLLWEQRLLEKEKLLDEREYKLDSTKKELDSVAIHRPSIEGRWQVKMQCVETSCDGSAIGDVKIEQWEFERSDNDNIIIVKAYTGKNLTRIYSGSYTYSGLKLVDNASAGGSTAIEATLRILKEGKMDGLREIIAPNCKTTYSLSLDRIKTNE
ncbi:hypothetical protein PIECOFPK_00982 [Mycovorax composti]|jgi:hypothetical protein|uniref:Uncharacterized protein n=2 Tax=Chitinophagaceae TaxID=563835 RepID=A0ABZ2EIQ5_9BACT